MHRISGCGQAIVIEPGAAPYLDQLAPAEVAQVAGDGRLGQVQDADEIADAEFAGGEQVEKADAGRIGDAAEDGVNVGQVEVGAGGEECFHGVLRWASMRENLVWSDTSVKADV